jgi:hypothetical protein
VLISEFISLDGVVQAPGGHDEDPSGAFRHGGWSMPYFDPEVMGPTLMESVERTEAALQGRRTYQVSAAAWPEQTDDDDPFASLLNAMQKYVVSDTLTQDDLTWGPATWSGPPTCSTRWPSSAPGPGTATSPCPAAPRSPAPC